MQFKYLDKVRVKQSERSFFSGHAGVVVNHSRNSSGQKVFEVLIDHVGPNDYKVIAKVRGANLIMLRPLTPVNNK